MNKNCKQCEMEFKITDGEVAFLAKISPVFSSVKYDIPLPEDCPDCRLKGRTLHRNEQYFYQNKSAFSGKPLISLFSPDTDWGKKNKIVSYDEWWSDDWDAIDYGMEFDFNRSFFEQFDELNLKIPKLNLMQLNNENSPYTTGTGYCNNCHLINSSENDEDCYYGKLIQSSRDIMDSSYVYNSELLYECFNVTKCYDCKYVSYSQNCSDCWFSEGLNGCRNCFLCTNLNNKEYYFLNKPLKKEEYDQKIKGYLCSTDMLLKSKELWVKIKRERVHKYSNIVNCDNSTGDFLTNCKNCTECFDVNDSEDCKYVSVGVNVKDLMDCSNMYLKPELNYQVMGTIETYNVIFSLYIFHSSNVMYSQNCFNCSDLFGCSGLRGNKKYCVLNKQYTEEEYKNLIPKIIEHMRETGEWGLYFPPEYSFFGYNETLAQEYMSLTKEEAMANGYKWKDIDPKEFKKQNFVVPSDINEVKDNIIEHVLACEKCGRNYKIIPQELKRLRDMNFPVLRKCPDCRYMERMTMHNPRKLWARKCANCSEKIETTYSPDRHETILCEKCYLKEVY